jgi:hypothetical protein
LHCWQIFEGFTDLIRPGNLRKHLHGPGKRRKSRSFSVRNPPLPCRKPTNFLSDRTF